MAGNASTARLSDIGGQGWPPGCQSGAPDGGLGGAFATGDVGLVLVCYLGRVDGEAAHVGGMQGRLRTRKVQI